MFGFPPSQTYLIEHIAREAHHGEVVNDEDGFDVDRLLICHKLWSEPHNYEVAQEDTGNGDGRVHQQPWICPFVWGTHNIGIPFMSATDIISLVVLSKMFSS